MNNMDFMGRGQPVFRPPVRNFDDFSRVGGYPPHPNGDMCFNPMNQINPGNAFFVAPCDVFPQMMDFGRGRSATGANQFRGPRPGFPSNMNMNGNMIQGGVVTSNGIMPPVTSAAANGEQNSDSIDDIMYVFSKHCGRIIGKGGNRIREIQDSTGARIKIHSQEQPVNGQTRVTISGNVEQRIRGKQMIEEIISEGERRDGHPIGNNMTAPPPPGSLGPQGPSMDGLARWPGNPGIQGLPPGGPMGHMAGGPPHPTSMGVANCGDVSGLGQAAQQQAAAAAAMLMPYGGGGGGQQQHQQSHSQQMHQQGGGGGGGHHMQMPPRINTWHGGQQQKAGGRGDYEEELSNQFSRMMEQSAGRRKVDQESYPVIKNFYIEDAGVAAMTPEQRDTFFAERQNIIVSELKSAVSAANPGGQQRTPNPIGSFQQAFHAYPEILAEIQRQGFTSPTPIQCMAWPILMSGLDFIGIAQTGTGKTLAFLLPALIHIEGQTKPRAQRRGPTVLILSPTRELALQIQAEVERYRYRGIRCICVYGGAERRSQLRRLEEGADIVVATPGRLNDLIDSNRICLAEVSYLVLDEADRMLDMGFEPQVVKALWEVRSDRQTVMTSATWPAGVRRISQTYMDSPIQVNVGTLDLNACHDVTQHVELVNEEDKQSRIMHFVMTELGPREKALIFVGRKAECSLLASTIQCMEGAPNATCIHGDLDQSSREEALEMMRCGEVRVLVATDLASRGLDIKDIAYVLNYDFPRNIEEYVHRVGRTGRAGRTGISITLMTRNDWRHADDLIGIMEEAGQLIPPELRAMAERYARRHEEGNGGGGGRNARGGRGRQAGGGMKSGGVGPNGMNGGGRRPMMTNGGGMANTNGFMRGPPIPVGGMVGGDFGGVFDARVFMSGGNAYETTW